MPLIPYNISVCKKKTKTYEPEKEMDHLLWTMGVQ